MTCFELIVRNEYAAKVTTTESSLPLTEYELVRNLQVVDGNWPNSRFKFIYMSITCRYLVKGIMRLRHIFTAVTGICSLIGHLKKYSSA